MTTETENNESIVLDGHATALAAPSYEVSEDRSSKSRMTTILGIFFGMLLAFGGIYMMGQAFEVPEQYAIYMFGGGILVDAMGFWLAFWAIHKIDAEGSGKH